MTREEFIKDLDPWSNHRVLLWEALELTSTNGAPILEMGCGNGSTPYLQQYAKDSKRELVSMDNNEEWAKKFGAKVTNWNPGDWFFNKTWSVVLIDHAPGESRRVVLDMFARTNFSGIAVIHDSEPVGWNASDYQVRPLFKKFKYVVDYTPEVKGQPWTTMLSNTVKF